jgi:hypothetical protein
MEADMSESEQDRQDRIDESIARQLAGSMRINALLRARVDTLRSALDAIQSNTSADTIIRSFCSDVLANDAAMDGHGR